LIDAEIGKVESAPKEPYRFAEPRVPIKWWLFADANKLALPSADLKIARVRLYAVRQT